ncbi:hypothetical protein D7V97_00170 [Corallococcus sp. CA053C]|uniref:hypothetical protein n=1 Tax=Corallococcus sp. CA053C TaxID=2316732 RepID=UPI000EA361E9|nr:hypothetical protein [Corallococcus sp. CA053C]RKH15443.1 hypothetical protein D7V97_00170 [Corallococcus sp. CA053C]
MDAYLAVPTPANFDGLVRTLALEQATSMQTALQASRDRLAADPNALLGMQTVARQTQTLANYVLASTQLPLMPERFDTLRPFAQAVDPSWAQVSFEQLTQDPALYQRLLKDLDTARGPLSGSGPLLPQGPNPELASALQDFRPTMDVLMGPPHAAGVALSESVKRAGEQLDYARKQYPELAALDLGTLLGTRDASQVVATLDARLAEVDSLVGALRTGTPGASDLFPIAMLAAQLVGSELVAHPSTANLQAFDAAFQSVQTIQQARVDEQRVDLALKAVNLIAGAGAFFASGGLSILFYGASLVTNVAQGKRLVDQYQGAQQLSQYNAGGILDMSGVKRPSESAFALDMAFTVASTKRSRDRGSPAR